MIRAVLILGVAFAALGCGSEANSEAYNSSLSQEVPKPRADGPTFSDNPGIAGGGGKMAAKQASGK